MSTIVTRAGKGTPLTHNEVDANFTNLNTDKYQSGDAASFISMSLGGTDIFSLFANLDGGATGAVDLPVGTTAQRPSVPVEGQIRRNTTTGLFEGYDGSTWGSLGGAGLFKGENGTSGDTAFGAGDIFRVHEQTLNTNTTIAADENAVAAGPLAIASGVTLTVTSGGTLVIV